MCLRSDTNASPGEAGVPECGAGTGADLYDIASVNIATEEETVGSKSDVRLHLVCREVNARWFTSGPRGRGTEAGGCRTTHESAGGLAQCRFRGGGYMRDVLEAKPGGVEAETREEVLVVARLLRPPHRLIPKVTSLDLTLGFFVHHGSA